ncbi:MAG: hypothetical protein ACYTG7_21060 [Planctomycetota bacterium]
MDPEEMIRRARESLLKNSDAFRIPETPPATMPLLEKIKEKQKAPKPFADLDVLFIQHNLGPLVARLQAMKESGMDPGRCWFVDIPYSTNKQVVDRLVEIGFRRDRMALPFDDPLADYSIAQENRIGSLMELLMSREDPRPLLVVDDGAYFARFLNKISERSKNLLDHFNNTSVVEQTTRGHRYLVNHALEVIKRCNISAVTIAKCKTKTRFEGPFIGTAVARAMKNKVGKERIAKAKHIAVIGFGVVGRATVDEIKKLCPDGRKDIVDIDCSLREQATSPEDNCHGLPQLSDDYEYDVVMGCTGYNSFHLDQRKMLADKAVLASGSSAAIEFNRSGFIELADRYNDDEIEVLDRENTRSAGIHAEIRFRQEKGKTFSFLNAGFPVNFDGKLECLPSVLIQATHGLLYQASIQTLEQKGAGVNTVDPVEDDWIFDNAVDEISEL